MKIEVYTDGSCSGNPGIGGYGAILMANGHERIVRGTEHDKDKNPVITTNNRMELMAMLKTIEWIDEHQKEPCDVTFYTDSKYVMDCALGRNKDGSKRKISWFKGRDNEDLWMQFITRVANGKHTIHWVKVKGHSEDGMNARADAIAKEERNKAKYGLVFKKVEE